MTYRELMMRTLMRVTDQPRGHLEQVLEEFARRHPGKNRLDEDIPPDKAAVLEEEFRREASGILAWYARRLQQSDELRENRIQSIRGEKPARPGRKRR